jgi:phage repressor protein C with HTH and peptisase S24 domain
MILVEDITPGAPRKHRGGPFVASLFVALVAGPSMVPTLRDGDAVVVVRGGRPVRPGDVVVATFRARPDLLVVKRAAHAQDGGWWLRSDNDFVTDDSRAHGVADVHGRVLFRYWPRPSRIRSRIMLDS